MKRLLTIVGTRPNFMKVTRLKRVAEQHGGLTVELVHTGQHTDDRMSTVFFDQFGLRPDRMLSIPDGSPAARMGELILALEPVMRETKPDAVMVVGDVDSTLAGAIAANKLGLPIVHLESGLRSGDMGMPEEVNRILADRITAHAMVTEASGRENLLKEGTDPHRIHMVGNTMIDTLVAYDEQIGGSTVLERLGLDGAGHVLMTIHRPNNVDDANALSRVLDLIASVARHARVVLPVHPRTMRNLDRFGLKERLTAINGLTICEPLGYFDFQRLVATSSVVITDSGGVQEETTFRGIPCLTLRPSTERPVTVTEGTNTLITFDAAQLDALLENIRSGSYKRGRVPDSWDGCATERVVDVLHRVL